MRANDREWVIGGALPAEHRAGRVEVRTEIAKVCKQMADKCGEPPLDGDARTEAGRLAVEAWNKRMLGFQGPAQPSPTLGDTLNAGYGYLAS